MNINYRFAFSVLVLLSALFFSGCAGTPIPAGVGVGPEGSVPSPAPPPDSPNCVSSFVDPGEDAVHGILPIPRTNLDAPGAQARIRAVLESEDRTEIFADRPGYIHAVQYTKVWKFPDDVEFWFPSNEEVIHFRSAARLGKGDMGVNRKRMERIRTAFIEG